MHYRRYHECGRWLFVLIAGISMSSCGLFSPSDELTDEDLATAVSNSIEATLTTESRVQTLVAATVAVQLEGTAKAAGGTDDVVGPEEFTANPTLAAQEPLQLPTYAKTSEPIVTPQQITPPVSPTETPAQANDTPIPPSVTSAPSPYGELAGRIAFTRNPFGHQDNGHEIYVLDLTDGSVTRLTENNVPDWDPHWSRDGQQIAFVSLQDDNYDIWVMRADGSGQVNRIALPAWDDYPVWSPDMSQLAFVSTGVTEGKANSEVFVGSDTNNVRQVTFNTGPDEWPSWAPDGYWLADSSNRDGDFDIYLFTADGENVTQWTNAPGYDEQPAWSPDGQWLAFIRKTVDTNGSGGLDRRDDGDYGDVWIGRRDGTEFRQLTFDNAAADPAWSPDGRYIVFAHFKDSNGDGQIGLHDASDLWVIPVAGGDPIILLEGPEQDWSPDWTR